MWLTHLRGAYLPQVDHEGRGVDRGTLARLHPRVDGVGAPDGRCLVRVRLRVRAIGLDLGYRPRPGEGEARVGAIGLDPGLGLGLG